MKLQEKYKDILKYCDEEKEYNYSSDYYEIVDNLIKSLDTISKDEIILQILSNDLNKRKIKLNCKLDVFDNSFKNIVYMVEFSNKKVIKKYFKLNFDIDIKSVKEKNRNLIIIYF